MDAGGRAVWGVGLRLLACWDCGFECPWGHGCLSLMNDVFSRGRGVCNKPIPGPEESYLVCMCHWVRSAATETVYTYSEWVEDVWLRNKDEWKTVNTSAAEACKIDAGLLARSQHSEGPATGHFHTGFSWFPCVYKQMLWWFPRFQVATTCFSCSPT